MNYLKDIVYDNIQYILCRPNKQRIKVIKDIKFQYKYTFKDIDELNFELPCHIENKLTHQSEENKLMKLIKDKYLVCRYNTTKNKKDWFVIIEKNKTKNIKEHKEYLQVKCKSLQYNLGGIDFPTIKGTFQLYKDPNDLEQTGEGIINIIPQVSNWKIGYVSEKAKNNFVENVEITNPALTTNRNGKTIHPVMGYNYNKDGIVDNNNFAVVCSKDGKIQSPILDQIKVTNRYISKERKYRSFEIDSKKIISVIREEIETAFDVVFYFDTDREEINIFSIDEINRVYKRRKRVTEKYNLTCDRDSKVINSLKDLNYNGDGIIENNELLNIPINKNLNEESDIEVQNNDIYLHKDYDINDNVPNINTEEEFVISNIENEIYLHLSDRKYLKQLNKKSESEKIITRLHIFGKDDVSIDEFNLFGGNYLEDFSFYRNLDYMDKSFMEAFDKYDALLIEKQAEFEKLLSQKIALQQTKSTVNTQLNTLKTELIIAEENFNLQQKKGGDISYYKIQVDEAKARIEVKENELKTIEEELKAIDILIQKNSESIQKENNFTKEQLDTINRVFLKEDVWKNENYFKEIKKELLEAGKKALKKLSTPPIEFSIDCEFCKDVDMDKIKIGNMVDIIIPNDTNIKLRIIEISGSDNADKNDIKIIVSNLNEKKEASRQLGQSLAHSQKITTSVSNNKYKWDIIETTSKTVEELINNNLDTAKNEVVINQSSKIDRYGYEMSDTTDDKKRLKLTNGSIVMTDDGWLTAKVAITPDGIIGERIIGKLIVGKELFIQNSSGSVKFDENGLRVRSDAFVVEGGIPDEMIPSAIKWNNIEGNMTKYIDLQTKDLNKNIIELNNAVDMFSSDEFITLSESKTLEQELKKVQAESTQFMQFARDLGITTELDNYTKALDNLTLELRQWVGLPNYPVKILELNRLKVTKLFETVESTKTILINKINNVLATNAENKAKEYTNTQVQQVNQSLDTLSDGISKFSSDNYITKDEANNLKVQLTQVKAESEDIINLGSSFQLTTYVNNYVTALASLENFLNKYINQANYPIEINAIDRNVLLDLFEDVQKYKSELINKINQKIGEDALSNANTYTNSKFQVLSNEISLRVKTVDYEKTIMSLNESITQAEQTIKDNNINFKVSYDNLHKQTKLTETFDITVLRNQPVINPLMSLNYNGNGVFGNNTLINVVNENREINKLADIEVQNGKIYQYKEGIGESVDKANSEIDMLKNAITLKVSEDTFNNTITNINKDIASTNKTITESVGTINSNINNLQSQLDSKIDIHYYKIDPTLTNLPASEWNTDELKQLHLGDLYYNIVTGNAFKFEVNNNVYSWGKIENQDIIKALNDAQKAQNIANGKNSVYYTQPTPPYYKNDLWVNGQDMKICTTTRETGSFVDSDWVLGTKYTDDTTANAVREYAEAQIQILSKSIELRVTTETFNSTVSELNGNINNASDSINNFVNNTYVTDKENLQNQIDGKIETWFQSTNPNTWTTIEEKNKHNGDMWFNTSSKTLSRYNSNTNAWEQIQDQKAIDAYNKASTAQDTADGKRTIFTTQPTTPYKIGDLWKVDNVTGVDFKICATSRESGNFVSTDWTNVSSAKNYVDGQILEVNNSMQTLQTSINNVGKDLKLTAVEANTLKIDLERVTSESTDIINVANALNITTEKTNYSSALTTLTNYLNANWLNKVYPLNITQTQIDNITNYFKDLENKKSILINKISAIREQNAKSYIDTQKQELDNSINGLNTTITSAFSDNSLTNIEAQSLKTAYQNVVKEADDVIAIANSLSISTTNITIAKTNLTTEINKWIDKTSYPLPITTTDRTNMNNAFINLQSAIVQLNKAIEDKKVGQAETNARSYTEAQIKILNESINLKVSKDNIVNQINLSTEGAKIDVNKLDITGLVTISSLQQAGTVAINGSNVKIGGSGGDGELIIHDKDDKIIGKFDKDGLLIRLHEYDLITNDGHINAFRIEDYLGNVLLNLSSSGEAYYNGVFNMKNPVSGGYAIVDSGYNTNGEWVRFYNGTQICYSKVYWNVPITTAYGSVYYNVISETFPIAFINTPIVSAGFHSSGVTTVALAGVTTTTARFDIINPTKWDSGKGDIHYIAIGKWK